MAYGNKALVALGASASASSYQGSYTPARIIDLDSQSYWASGSYPVTGAWIKVNLGQPWAISHHYFLQRPPGNDFATSVKVQYSTDDVVWHDLEIYTCDTQAEEWDHPAVTAQYWKATSMAGGSQWWGVQLWEIWGDTAEATGTLPCDPTVGQVLQYVWDNTYQAAYDWLETLDPGVNFDPVLVFILASTVVSIQTSKAVLCGGGGPGGTCLFDDTDMLAAIAALDGVVDSGISAIALNDNSNTASIMAKLGASATSLEDQIAEGVQDGLDATFARGTDVISAVSAAQTHIETNDNSNTSGIVGTINAARDHVEADAAVKYAALTETVTDGLAQQTTDLAGPLGTTHDAILTAVQAIPDYGSTLQDILDALSAEVSTGNQWPGSANVQLGLSQQVTGPALLSIPMDGCLVTVEGVPNGQSHQTANGCTRYKGLGWLAFQSDGGDFEEMQTLHLNSQLFRPRDMLQAQAVAVYCKPGTTLTVQTYTIT